MMMSTMYNVPDLDDFRSSLLFFSRLVGEASPEVRAAAIRLAISTLVPIVGGAWHLALLYFSQIWIIIANSHWSNTKIIWWATIAIY